MPDYGLGQTNIDKNNGIRYGVIPQNEVLQSWADSSEGKYGDATYSDCLGICEEGGRKDYHCPNCDKDYWADSVFPDSPLAFILEDEEYIAQQSGDDSDIFILKSPYYSLRGFCSPCAPGAGYLLSDGNVMTYCFDPSWFDNWENAITGKYNGEKTSCPYPVYRVSDNELVFSPWANKKP